MPPALVGGAVFALLVVSGLVAQPFEYDADEGFNLMKASLVARGHALYREIWSDQPPLHTLLLAKLFAVTGESVTAARVLTAAFAGVAVGALYDVARTLTRSTRVGLIAAGLLAASGWYPRLGFSAMIGLPSLAFATASLAPLVRLRATDPGARTATLLTLSAGLMAAAIVTKLFAALVVVPAVTLVAIGLHADGASSRTIARAILAWLALVVAGSGLAAWATGASLDTLLATHVSAATQRPWRTNVVAHRLLGRDTDLLVLTVAALAMAASGVRRRALLPPMLWFAGAAVVLQLHYPIWYHHGLLLTLPAAWGAAIVLDTATRWRGISRGRARRALTVLLVGFAIWQGAKLAMSVGRMAAPRRPEDARVVAAMRRRAPATTWVFADRPIYPFMAGLVVPPELAVTSKKRRETGGFSDELLLRILAQRRPEQMLLGRLTLGPPIMRWIRAHYRRAAGFEGRRTERLFIRADLPDTETGAPPRAVRAIPP